MDAKGKKRIIIWVSVAALLGVGGYVAYKLVKAKRDKKKAEEEAALAVASSSTTPTSSGGSAPTSSGSSSSGSNSASESTAAYEAAWNAARKAKTLAFSFQGKVYSSVTGQVVPNPFQNTSQIRAFQSFVKNTLKDNSIGNVDGLWGVKTASAFIKYASLYYANK
jgi:hypothetical protein